MALSGATVLSVVQDACGELGLSVPSTVMSATDTTTIQMRTLLKSIGRKMLFWYPWEGLREEWVFNTVNGQESYDLPEDWAYFFDQSQWDRTNRWPLLGPKNASEWQWLKSGVLSQGPRIRFRVMENKLALFPTPGATAVTLAMEYIKNTWVTQAAGPTPADTFVADNDTLFYNTDLIVAALKLRFWEVKGFDTTTLAQDFQRVWDTITGNDTGAPVVSLSPRPQSIYIGPWNVPDGNWPT